MTRTASPSSLHSLPGAAAAPETPAKGQVLSPTVPPPILSSHLTTNQQGSAHPDDPQDEEKEDEGRGRR
jgi:hypothetical protein